MSNVLNTHLLYQNNSFIYYYSVNNTYRAISSDSFVLRGTGVALDDQQHEDNSGVNYLSYRVKHIRLHGTYWFSVIDRIGQNNLVVVLYHVPAKYETGIVRPAATTQGFLQLKDYVLYSNPRSVLSWGVFSPRVYDSDGYRGKYAFDVSLSSDKDFVLGPNDLLCCNLLFSYKGPTIVYSPVIDFTAKVYYDLN